MKKIKKFSADKKRKFISKMAQSVPISDFAPHQGTITVTKCATVQPPPVTSCATKEITCTERPVCAPCGPICVFKPLNWCLLIIWFVVIALIIWFVLYLFKPEFIMKKKGGRRGGDDDDDHCGWGDFDWKKMILGTLVITAIIMVLLYLFGGCRPW